MSPARYLREWIGRVFAPHWLGPVDRIATMLGILVPLLLKLHPTLTSRVENLVWQIPLGVGIALPFVRLVVAPYWMYRDLARERDEVVARVGEIERAAPRLKIARCFVDRRDRITAGIVMNSPGPPFFAHVIVVNDPPSSAPTAIATGVLAKLTYVDGEGNRVSAAGRWGDTEQPGPSPTASTVDLQTTDIAIGMERELDIAMKYPNDEDCYAFSARAYLARDWGLPEYRLRGQNIQITVRLRGERVDEEWRFVVTNEGPRKGLRIEPA